MPPVRRPKLPALTSSFGPAGVTARKPKVKRPQLAVKAPAQQAAAAEKSQQAAREEAAWRREQAMRAEQSQAPGAPGAAGATPPAGEAAPPKIDPRDGLYTEGVTGLIQRIAAQRAAMQLEQSQDDSDFATSMQRLAESRAGDLEDTNSGANRQGLFYSTVLRDRRNKLNDDYDARKGDAELAKQRRGAARVAALAGLGNIVKDDSNVLGYRGEGAAGADLMELFAQAIARARGEE